MSDAVRKEFVLKKEKVDGKCCPIVEPVACRVGNTIYQEGQTWPSTDPCKNLTCARDVSGRLTHQESVATCTRDCKKGWVYQEPPKDQCCGHCVQEKCVVDDKLVAPGTTWQSQDNCTTYSCDKSGEEVFVTSMRQSCPDISLCGPENIVNGTCCPMCEEPAQALSKCAPKSTPNSKMTGIIRKHIRPHGLCINKEPIAGLMDCEGSCDSSTAFNNATATHDSNCECCQALKYNALVVTLTCEDGTKQPHKVATPSKCGCAACGGVSVPSWKKPGYSGAKNPPVKSSYTEREDIIPEIYQRFGETEKPIR